MFSEFDFEILNDPDFKEDSVREELVLPIIKNLGYSVSGDSRIIRSKALIHPYVAIGSQQRKVSIIPDYVFLSKNKPYWILDAKSPSESISKSKHVEQAYSYAIHPEVRAELFSLCNGKEFVLYSIRHFDPILKFNLENINEYWEKLHRILNPEIKAHPEVVNYNPDYGLHLHRLGVEKGFMFMGMAVNSNFIAKVQDGLYTMVTLFPGDVDYAISLDFSESKLIQFLSMLPESLSKVVITGLKRQPYSVFLEEDEFRFGVVALLNGEIMSNAEESYISFEVQEFMTYKEMGV